VTERKEREAARQESEDRFRLLADAVDDVFWITDVRPRRVIYVSPAYERVWGFSAERLYRDPKAWREHLHPEDRALVDQEFDQMLAGRRESFELTYRMQGPDGAPRWVRDKAWLVRSGDGERIAGVMTDISAEKESEEKQRLLNQELDHRLKNSFALVQSIVRLSAQSAQDLDAFIDSLEARLRALARGQDVLVAGSWQVADLEEIVREMLAPHVGPENRVQIEGPPVQVAASAVPLFNMAFHELATNATKYGALSVPGGNVSVCWQVQADEAGPALWLTWHESGGPRVPSPPRRGFGSMLIEQALASEFGGEIEIAFPPEGVTCSMRLPFSERLMLSRNAA
jgi:PAS domain S-box-containing protein